MPKYILLYKDTPHLQDPLILDLVIKGRSSYNHDGESHPHATAIYW